MQVDLSKQSLTNEQFQEKVNELIEKQQPLMSINVSDNEISNPWGIQQLLQQPFVQKHLKILSFANNKIKSLTVHNVHGLFSLDLSYCAELEQLDFDNLPNLKTLDLRFTKVGDNCFLNIIQQTNVKQLRLTGTQISDAGVESVIKQKELHQKLRYMSALELKNTNCKKYLQINQILREIDGDNAPKARVALPALQRPASNTSRVSSSCSSHVSLAKKMSFAYYQS